MIYLFFRIYFCLKNYFLVYYIDSVTAYCCLGPLLESVHVFFPYDLLTCKQVESFSSIWHTFFFKYSSKKVNKFDRFSRLQMILVFSFYYPEISYFQSPILSKGYPLFFLELNSSLQCYINRHHISFQHGWNASVEMACVLVIQIEIQAV